MAAPRSVNRDDMIDLFKRVEKLERMAPTGQSSVTSGQFRIASVDGLLVEGQGRVTGILVVDGTLQVTGTESISGTLIVSGGQIITGTFRIDGETTINGHTVFNGPTDIIGALGLSGTLTVKPGGNIDVQNGTVKVGTAMTLDPNVSSGAVVFSNGSQVFTDGGSIQVYLGNGAVQVSDDGASMTVGGTGVIVTSADGVRVNDVALFQNRATFEGKVFASGLPLLTGTGAVPGTLMVDSSDEVHVAG